MDCELSGGRDGYNEGTPLPTDKDTIYYADSTYSSIVISYYLLFYL